MGWGQLNIGWKPAYTLGFENQKVILYPRLYPLFTLDTPFFCNSLHMRLIAGVQRRGADYPLKTGSRHSPGLLNDCERHITLLMRLAPLLVVKAGKAAELPLVQVVQTSGRKQ